ncbi:MAG TPA: DUF1579 family protein [Acidobacteriota bacterium]|nr:DUF1579 family protein [Acidobacteriota bacterium]
MKKSQWLLVIVLCCCLLPVWGWSWQEMPEFGAPKEMKKIDYMVGTWTADFQMRQDPSQEWVSNSVTMKVENMLDGCAQVHHWSGVMKLPDPSGQMQEMDFEGRATYTYNRQTSQWQSTWVDNLEGRQTMSTGGFEGDKLVFKGEDEYMGMTFHTRDTTTKVSDTEFNWVMEMSMDGGSTWFESMKAHFKKQ